MVARPITVVQMVPELNEGGVERGTVELASYLSGKGHRAIVISAGGRLVPMLDHQGSQHISWRVGRKTPATLRYLLSLRRFLVNENVDILHVRSRLPAWIGYIVWKSLPRNRRPRLVSTFHGYYSVSPYSAVMTKGEAVIAISKAIFSHIMETYHTPPERITLVYRGVDVNLFCPGAVSAHRIHTVRNRWQLVGNRSPVILMPGRLARWKGQEVFVRSLAKIKHLPWQALCVGALDHRSSYQKTLRNLIADERLEDRIRLVGHCDDMPAAYMVSDVVVSASSSQPEAFGRVVVEAQAMGRPVIATAHGGSLETVLDGQTGWLVKPNNVADLSTALGEALRNPALRGQLGRRGQEWVNDNFTVQKMCDKTLSLYRQLLFRTSENGI